MKYIFFITLIISASGLVSAQVSSGKSTKNIASVEWLVGTWNRTNAKPGRTAHERWFKISENELQGVGVMLQGSDTVFMEKLKIISRDNELFYVADVPENKEPVLFRFTEISKNGFVCENPEHDFPKKISYAAEGTKLRATISGNGKLIDYWFERN